MRARILGVVLLALAAVSLATRADAPIVRSALGSSPSALGASPRELSSDAAVARLAGTASVLAPSAPLVVAAGRGELALDALSPVSPARAAAVPEPPMAFLALAAGGLAAARLIRRRALQ